MDSNFIHKLNSTRGIREWVRKPAVCLEFGATFQPWDLKHDNTVIVTL